MTDNLHAIDALSYEQRKFPPSSSFIADALANDATLYDEAARDNEAFWARQARDLLEWSTPFTQICEWDPPYAEWFADGRLNVSYNCLDRHVLAGKGDKVAFYWEGEPGDARVVTYSQLLDEVQRFANALKNLGVVKGRPSEYLFADDS